MADEAKLLPGDAEPDASVTKRSLRRDFLILISRLPYGFDFFVALRSSAFFVANVKSPCSKLPFFLAAPDEEQRLCDTQATRLLFGTAGDKWLFGFMISLLSFFSLYSTIFSLVVGGVTKRCGAYDPKTFFLSKPSGWFIQSTRLILALFANFTPRSKVEVGVVALISVPFFLAVQKTVEYERETKKFKEEDRKSVV